MKRLLIFVAGTSLVLGTLSLSGCAYNDRNRPEDNQGATAGGNGAFGEDPARPGSYTGDRYSSPTTQPVR